MPDTVAIAEGRLEAVRRSYIEKVLQNQQVYKEKQANLDLGNDTTSVTSAAVFASSPTSQRSSIIEGAISLRSGFVTEPRSPGKGTPATGATLRKIKAKILDSLDEELFEEPFEVVRDMELTVPEPKWTNTKL